jgi:hypothetical protein
MDCDPPISDAIADGWANFSETLLPTVGGTDRAQANIAFLRSLSDVARRYSDHASPRLNPRAGFTKTYTVPTWKMEVW